ncbi:MAG: shikimate kinase [Desulfuromonadaceae bacterium GWC2_58_13]|nr:MAG: shikimate kinase [Desulfuromonadaceae bacterium GWC2_58_13]
MNIVLIGYRGTGKSEVGQRLADRLGRPLIGMDAEIVRQAGMSIPAMVERFGWSHFRDLETEEARALSGRDGLVIDCGGGVIERPENVDILRRNARIFWLRASVATIVGRIQGDTERPALVAGKTFTEEVAEVLDRRTPLYRNAAHDEIDTDALTPDQVADAILALWHREK